MQPFGTLLIFGALALIQGCSSDDDVATTNSATGSTGGATSVDTTTGGTTSTGGAGNATACNVPDCLGSAMSSCLPSGSCIQSTDSTTGTVNKCFDNGVNTTTTIAATFSMTAKKAGSTCYSVEGTFTSLQFKDGAGTVIATGTANISTGSVTITCTGQTPVTLNSGCNDITSALNPLAAEACTTGACTP